MDCKDCKHLIVSDEATYCEFAPIVMLKEKPWRFHKARVKSCEVAILNKHLPDMKGKVLEIGCGMWGGPRRLVRATAEWYGIDTRWKSKPEINYFQARVSSMPFPSNEFDFALAISSMEHWNEKGDTVSDGLLEVHRVLKDGAKFVVAAPIYNHGHDLFFLGNLKNIEEMFRISGWRDISIEKWAEDPAPLQPLQEWKNERQSRQKKLVDLLGREPFTYTIEIQATK